MLEITAGQGVLQIEPALVPLLAQRCVFSHLTPPRPVASEAAMTLRWVSRAPPAQQRGIALDAQHPEWGTYLLQERQVLAWIAPSPFAAEAALRAALVAAFLRQGGVLLHAAGVAFPTGALAILGYSGAGKSTLARAAVAAGGALLSDETVGLHPGGDVYGSPFRSDADLQPVLAQARLARLVAVVKGSAESTEPLPSAEAVRVVLQQAYRPAPELAGLSELVTRVGAWVERLGVHRFICRKDPAAGHFARAWVEAAPLAPGAGPRAS